MSQADERPYRVIVLGGMSECGKSWAGKFIASYFGAVRLKLGYLLHLAGVADPLDDANSADKARSNAASILRQLDLFSAKNARPGLFVLESLNGLALGQQLKDLLADRVALVYIDAPQAIRLARNRGSLVEFLEKDSFKRALHADELMAIADVVVDNSAGYAEFALQLINGLSGWLYEESHPEICRLDQWPDFPMAALKEALADILSNDDLTLCAVSGSPANGHPWQAGISDIDVLVVSECEPAEHERETLQFARASLARVGTLKVTWILGSELRAGLTTPRVLAIVDAIARGQLPVLAGRTFKWRRLEPSDVARRAAVEAGVQRQASRRAWLEVRQEIDRQKMCLVEHRLARQMSGEWAHGWKMEGLDDHDAPHEADCQLRKSGGVDSRDGTAAWDQPRSEGRAGSTLA